MLDPIASYSCMQFQRNLMNQIEKMVRKTSFGHDFGPFGLNSGCHFFSKIWLRQSLDIMVIYHHVQYQKKLTDRRMDAQMEESDFIGRCLTNAKCPILSVIFN